MAGPRQAAFRRKRIIVSRPKARVTPRRQDVQTKVQARIREPPDQSRQTSFLFAFQVPV